VTPNKGYGTLAQKQFAKCCVKPSAASLASVSLITGKDGDFEDKEEIDADSQNQTGKPMLKSSERALSFLGKLSEKDQELFLQVIELRMESEHQKAFIIECRNVFEIKHGRGEWQKLVDEQYSPAAARKLAQFMQR